jgi:hypothetical protein
MKYRNPKSIMLKLSQNMKMKFKCNSSKSKRNLKRRRKSSLLHSLRRIHGETLMKLLLYSNRKL